MFSFFNSACCAAIPIGMPMSTCAVWTLQEERSTNPREVEKLPPSDVRPRNFFEPRILPGAPPLVGYVPQLTARCRSTLSSEDLALIDTEKMLTKANCVFIEVYKPVVFLQKKSPKQRVVFVEPMDTLASIHVKTGPNNAFAAHQIVVLPKASQTESFPQSSGRSSCPGPLQGLDSCDAP